MTDLRALLGDKYEATIEKVVNAIWDCGTDYLGCGCCTGYDYNESVARTGEAKRERMVAYDALAAVLPDLLDELDRPCPTIRTLDGTLEGGPR